MIPGAAPFLALDIIRGDLLYSRNQDEQVEFELYVLRRAGDLVNFVCTQDLHDLEAVLDEILTWINQHHEMIDRTL